MALLAAVRTTRSLALAHQDGQQNFLDSLAHSGSGPSSTLNGCFGQAGMSDALCRSASSRGWLGSQLPSRGRPDGEEGEGLRLRRALQAASASGPVLCSLGGSSALACVRAPCAQRPADSQSSSQEPRAASAEQWPPFTRRRAGSARSGSRALARALCWPPGFCSFAWSYTGPWRSGYWPMAKWGGVK